MCEGRTWHKHLPVCKSILCCSLLHACLLNTVFVLPMCTVTLRIHTQQHLVAATLCIPSAPTQEEAAQDRTVWDTNSRSGQDGTPLQMQKTIQSREKLRLPSLVQASTHTYDFTQSQRVKLGAGAGAQIIPSRSSGVRTSASTRVISFQLWLLLTYGDEGMANEWNATLKGYLTCHFAACRSSMCHKGDFRADCYGFYEVAKHR